MSQYLQFINELDLDTLPGKVSGRYGISYLCGYSDPAATTRVYIRTWGVPALYDSFDQANAIKTAFAASITNAKYHSYRVVSARKAWEIAANVVEVHIGRRDSQRGPGNPKRPTHREVLMSEAGLPLGREVEWPPQPPKFTDKPVPVPVQYKRRIPEKV